MAESNALPEQTATGKRTSRFFGRYLIKTRFQFKFALMVLIFLGIATMTIWLFGNFALQKLVEAEAIHEQDVILQLENINSLVFNIAIIYMAAAAFLSLFFTHLVAGPIYRFEKTLEKIRDGNLTPYIKLRKRDEFKETAELFNQAILSLRKKVQKERDTMESLVLKMQALSEKMKLEGHKTEAIEIDKAVADLRNTPLQIKV